MSSIHSVSHLHRLRIATVPRANPVAHTGNPFRQGFSNLRLLFPLLWQSSIHRGTLFMTASKIQIFYQLRGTVTKALWQSTNTQFIYSSLLLKTEITLSYKSWSFITHNFISLNPCCFSFVSHLLSGYLLQCFSDHTRQKYCSVVQWNFMIFFPENKYICYTSLPLHYTFFQGFFNNISSG